MLKITNLIGFGRASAAEPKSVTYLTSAVSGSDLTTYTFAAQTLGTASASRKILVGVSGTQGTRTVSSLTVGGIAGELIGRKQGGVTTVELWIAPVPSGADGDVVINWSGAQDRCGIGLWGTTGLTSNTPVDTENWFPDSPGPSIPALTTVAGGFVVALACGHSAGTPTSTWGNITERYDAALEGGQPYHTGASVDTAGTTLTITHDMSTSGNGNVAGFAASF